MTDFGIFTFATDYSLDPARMASVARAVAAEPEAEAVIVSSGAIAVLPRLSSPRGGAPTGSARSRSAAAPDPTSS